MTNANEIKKAIHKLWELYFNDEDLSEAEKRLNSVTEVWRLESWFEADVKDALRKSKLEDVETIRQIVIDSKAAVAFRKCVEDAEIRLDFANALRNVKHGRNLSLKLSWCFGKEDLLNLMKLHKSNRFRKKIEDLLEDCNFHTECGLLYDRKYDEYEKFVKED